MWIFPDYGTDGKTKLRHYKLCSLWHVCHDNSGWCSQKAGWITYCGSGWSSRKGKDNCATASNGVSGSVTWTSLSLPQKFYFNPLGLKFPITSKWSFLIPESYDQNEVQRTLESRTIYPLFVKSGRYMLTTKKMIRLKNLKNVRNNC